MTEPAQQLSAYLAIYEPGAVDVTLDGPVRQLPVEHGTVPLSPSPSSVDGPWVQVWYEDEVYADSCHRSSPDVYVAHHDWSLWRADLDHNVGRGDDFNAVTFVDMIAEDLTHLGPRGRAALADDTRALLRHAKRLNPDGFAAHPCLEALAEHNLETLAQAPTQPADVSTDVSAAPGPGSGEVSIDDIPMPGAAPLGRRAAAHLGPARPVDRASGGACLLQLVVLRTGLMPASVTAADEATVTLEVPSVPLAAGDVEEFDRGVRPYYDDTITLTLPAKDVLGVLSGPFHAGADGVLHYLADECSHEVTTYPHDDTTALLACGTDFMAGTICSAAPGHLNGCTATCQWCGGDWVTGTCTCYPDDPGC